MQSCVRATDRRPDLDSKGEKMPDKKRQGRITEEMSDRLVGDADARPSCFRVVSCSVS